MPDEIVENTKKDYCLYYRLGKCTAKACRWLKTVKGEKVCQVGGYLGEVRK